MCTFATTTTKKKIKQNKQKQNIFLADNMTFRLALIAYSLVFCVTRATFTKLTLKYASGYQIIQSKLRKLDVIYSPWRPQNTLLYYEHIPAQHNVQTGKIDLYLHNNLS